MPEDREQDQPQGYTRRRILGIFSLGLAGVAGAAFLLRDSLFSRETGDAELVTEFPGEDSIFHPRRDPRLEARERRRRT